MYLVPLVFYLACTTFIQCLYWAVFQVLRPSNQQSVTDGVQDAADGYSVVAPLSVQNVYSNDHDGDVNDSSSSTYADLMEYDILQRAEEEERAPHENGGELSFFHLKKDLVAVQDF